MRALFLLILLALSRPAGAQDQPSDLRHTPVVRVVKATSPAVVNVGSEITERSPNPFFQMEPFDEFFREFLSPSPRIRRAESLGSGVIVHPTGLILTNEHVIARASAIKVTLADRRELDAQVIGADSAFDLAVLKVSSDQPLPIALMGHSDDLMPGETVIAIGNPFGLSHTVTTGVISAVHRSLKTSRRMYNDFIQTDASINPGNSGGPLLNIQGQVIGINTAIYKGGQGIGFAIPITQARRVTDNLLKFGRVFKGYMGLYVRDLSPKEASQRRYHGQGGVLVKEVDPQSPAARAGIRSGDILEALEGVDVRSAKEYGERVESVTVGAIISLKVVQAGQRTIKRLEAIAFPKKLALNLSRRVLGVDVGPITEESLKRYSLATPKGVVITGVYKKSPAQRIGMEPGDVIRQMCDREIQDINDFKEAMIRCGQQKGSLATIVQRGRRLYYVSLEID